MKNKVIYIVLFVLLFIILVSTQCFAIESSVLPEVFYDVMTQTDRDYFEDYSYYVLITDSSKTCYHLIYSDSPIRAIKDIEDENTGHYNVTFICDGWGRYNKISYDSETNSYFNGYAGTLTSDTNNCLIIGGTTSEDVIIVDSNYNIDINTSEDKVPSILYRATENISFEKVLQEVVNLLPVLLVVVVGLIGIRKAIIFLRSILINS